MTTTVAWDQRSAGQRFGVAATLTGAIAVVTLVPTLLAVLAPLITADLGLSRSGFGVVTTSVFIGGGLTSVGAGRVVDRLGGSRSLLLLFGLASATIVMVSLTRSYAWLLVATLAAGLPGALSNPVTNQVISSVVPAGRRGLIIGFKQSGAQLAQVGSGLVLPALALAFGWRGAALAVSVVPLVGIVATLVLLPKGSDVAVPRVPGRVPIRGSVAYLTAYALLLSLGAAAVITYLPLYAYEVLDFELARAGLAASVAAAAGFLGRVLWGRAAERWIAPSAGLILIGAGSVASVVAIAAAAVVPWLLWPGAVIFGGTAGAWSSVAMVVLLTEVDPSFAGRASGVVLLGFYGGFIISPIVFGSLADATGSYTVGWALVGLMFALGTVVAVRWQRHRAVTSG